MSDALFWVIGAVMLAAGVYTNYTNWKMYKASIEAKKLFLKNHSDGTTTKLSPMRAWLFGGLAIVCLALGIFIMQAEGTSLTESSRWSQGLVYLGLAIFCVAMVPEAIMDANIVHTPDGFMYADTYLRYKHIEDVFQSHNFFKSDKLIMTGKKEEMIPKPVAKWAEPEVEAYKARRKAARKKGRNR